jgi:acyl-CoA synthetase (AMP-forming)/AMP-acid ligase II
LLALGLKSGDRVAIISKNQPEYVAIMFGIMHAGFSGVPANAKLHGAELGYILEHSGARACFVSEDMEAEVAAHAPSSLEKLIRIKSADYERLLQADAVPVAEVDGDHLAWLFYTSGTTGRPKGVRTPLPDEPPEQPPRRLAMLQRHYGLDENTVLINPGPFYHAAPGRFMISVQRCGGTVIGFRKFDAESTLAAIQRYSGTHGVFVPTHFIRMLKLGESLRRAYDLHTMRCAIHLAAPCPIPVKEQMIAWWGPIIHELYGGTEAFGHTFITATEWLAHKGSVGRADTGCSIRILDEEGRELPPMTAGAIYMHNGHRFEYHRDPDKTRGVMTEDGWATFGDIGYLDAEGYLYLTDRQSYMIISGGVNIYPQEAENLLYSHPAIADVAVIGVPHAEFGEEVKAVVQPKDFPVAEPQALAADIMTWCRERLSPIKCPRSIDFVEELPRNEAGKLLKRLVKDRYWQGRASRIL